MSTHPVEPSAPSEHLERSVEDQLERAKPWAPAEEAVLNDLTDEEEAAILEALTR